jgi:DNA-binding MarR family transcriptional regulator
VVTRVSESTREALEVRKRASALQLLFKCARLANERALARTNERPGAPRTKGAHVALLPHLTYEGVRVVELARRLEISKQAVSQTLAEMVETGVVELSPDPSDGRAKLARLTSFGATSIAQGLAVLEALERELAQEIGDSKMRALHDALVALESALDG